MAANNESMRKILATELSEKQQKDYELILDSLSFQSQRGIHYIRLYKLLAYGRIDDFEHQAKVMKTKFAGTKVAALPYNNDIGYHHKTPVLINHSHHKSAKYGYLHQKAELIV